MEATATVPKFMPEDGTYSMFPHEIYGWLDLSMGMILGVYTTLNVRQRNSDCSSRLFNLGVSVADYHKNYDRQWEHLPLRWVTIIFKVIFDIYGTYFAMKQCMDQLSFSAKYPWLAAYKNETALPAGTSASSPNSGYA